MVFSGHAFLAETGEVILLKFVESMRLRNEEDEIIDKLKGDVSFVVRTISGREYIVSMNTVHGQIGGAVKGEHLAAAIYDKWMWIHKP